MVYTLGNSVVSPVKSVVLRFKRMNDQIQLPDRHLERGKNESKSV